MSRFAKLFCLVSLVATTSGRPKGRTYRWCSSPDDVPPTVVTVVDGDVTAAGQGGDALLDVLRDTESHPDLDAGSVVTKRDISLKKRDTYEQVFASTGTRPNDRDASIQGTAYLTCVLTEGLVVAFVNLFYEFNSDAAHNPQIKCAAYGDVHPAAEKTNFGGQQLLPPPAGKSYIQQSVGYASGSLADPPVPDGYDLPILQYLATLVSGNPTTYTCAMYYVPADALTATNTGQGNLQVTYSRGYRRITYLPDGSFESCVDCDSCWTLVNPNCLPTSPPGGDFDAELFYRPAWAHTGHSFAILGSGFGSDAFAGTLTPKAPLNTVAGKQYLITFFQQSMGLDSQDAVAEAQWNGATVLTINPGFQAYTYYEIKVTAAGNDALAFHGGSFPAYDFLDDIYVFLA
ncbi:hypothetical protein BDN72DRAFT_855015 [Pluteus cervinus]|uniref:Uncharacterized protein n=1 Tax=Pluteus cervinus TaxID=181527 RepID=A0ACD3B5T7_9AGAR|nr:hypothetical protein BDN72DRAFT_855015 [Pluteus cervinus]